MGMFVDLSHIFAVDGGKLLDVEEEIFVCFLVADFGSDSFELFLGFWDVGERFGGEGVVEFLALVLVVRVEEGWGLAGRG